MGTEDKKVKLVLKQELPDRNPIFTIKGLLAQTKRYLVCWLVVSIVAALVTTCIVGVLQKDEAAARTMVEFSFDGIEKGKDPAGNAFDALQIKAPVVIERALNAANVGGSNVTVDQIRNAITVKGVTPSDALDKLNGYKSVFESGNFNVSTIETIMNYTYFPTRYIIELNAAQANLDNDEAVAVLDAVVAAYKEYFFESYGYNRTMGTSIAAIDYNDYDYERAVEVLDSSVESVRKYVNTLATQDATKFRSNTTGYTFSDLAASLSTVQSEDLQWLSSYIVVNCVTKDKSALITNYEYRVSSLERDKAAAEEVLAGIDTSLATYEKDTILVNTDAEGNSIMLNQASEAYDSMISQRVEKLDEIASLGKSIEYYKSRINSLKTSNIVTTSGKMEYVDSELKRVYTKIIGLLEQVELTTDEYYTNVAFANVFTVLMPANISAGSRISSLISAVLVPVLLLEFLILAAFIVFVACKAYAAQHLIPAESDSDDTDDSVVAETAESAKALKKNKKD